jgi:fatty acid desaturase
MWTIHGSAYDLGPLLRTHPGGERILELTRGTDCTALFESYHAFSDAPRALLSRYGPPYAGAGVDPMLEDVHRAAREILGSRAASKTPLRVTCALVLAQAAALALVVLTRATWCAAAFGLVLATCATRVIHACSHNATFVSPRLNAALGELASAPLFPFAAWVLSHALSHHPHTNDAALDVDVAVLFAPRTAASLVAQLVAAAVPVPVRIGMLRLVPWSIPTPIAPLSPAAARHAIASTLVFVAFHAGALALVDGWAWLAFVYMHVCGLYFLFFSQLSHLPSLAVDLADRDAARRTPPWSERQVRATEDYEGASRAWHFLSFGLTHQIEHHLLPGVSESHLPAMRGAVRAACQKHGVPYRDNSIRVATARLARFVRDALRRPPNANRPRLGAPLAAPVPSGRARDLEYPDFPGHPNDTQPGSRLFGGRVRV